MKLGVVMDPIESINFKKASTLAMMLEAQAREHQLFYITPNSLYLNKSGAHALATTITVKNDPSGWFEFNEENQLKLSELDVILIDSLGGFVTTHLDLPTEEWNAYEELLFESINRNMLAIIIASDDVCIFKKLYSS